MNIHKIFVVLLGSLLLIAPNAWSAGLLKGTPWKVSPDFESGSAAMAISGAACNTLESEWCLAVNDEKNYAQFFSARSIDTLTPRERVRLLPDTVAGVAMDEIDAEAVTYADGYYYVTGSHGAARKSGAIEPSRFFVFRIPVDRKTGAPPFKPSKDVVDPRIDRTDALRNVLRAAPTISAYSEKPLDQNGLNIEGLAASNGSLFFALRGPNWKGWAHVVEVKADALFHQYNTPPVLVEPGGFAPSPDQASGLEYVVYGVQLGDGIGIRDLVKVDKGFLLLTGLVADAPILPSIVHWSPQSGQVTSVGMLDQLAKAESLQVLLSTVTYDPKTKLRTFTHEVLVLFDGIKNGGPRSYKTAPMTIRD